MAKEFDIQTFSTMLMGVVETTFEKMYHIKSSTPPTVTTRDIIEYDGRMRVFPMEKFNGPVYISVINYYLSQRDMEQGRAVGTFIMFVKEEQVEKFMKAFGHSTRDAEDPEIVMNICGEMCSYIASNVKDELVRLGYADLTLSAPQKFKNNIPEGVGFNYNLYQKQEFFFTFWNQKCVAIEACMGNIPMKGH